MSRPLHEKVTRLLQERGYAERDLGQALGATPQRLAEVLKGRTPPTLAELKGLVSFFGLRADYWLNDGREEPTAEDVTPEGRGKNAEALRRHGVTRAADPSSFQEKVRAFVLNHPEEWAAQFGPLSREELELMGLAGTPPPAADGADD